MNTAKALKTYNTMNQFIIAAVSEFCHPIQSQNSIDVELQRINTRLDQIRQEDSQIQSDRLIEINHDAQLCPEDSVTIQEKILNFLRTMAVPQSIFMIAEELHQEADIIYIICSYLETQNKIHTTNDFRWEIK